VVATTDAISAISIAKRVGLPQGIVDVLEGESLLNDATGLLALEFGVAMVVTGETPKLGSGLLRLSYLIVVEVALGLVLGVIVESIHSHIDGPIEITLSIICSVCRLSGGGSNPFLRSAGGGGVRVV
jgi:NhaP-type Na+/H+ or K+/H+ antiporter